MDFPPKKKNCKDRNKSEVVRGWDRVKLTTNAHVRSLGMMGSLYVLGRQSDYIAVQVNTYRTVH
jgi:hypothetical protein